jgi:hypothetical protein
MSKCVNCDDCFWVCENHADQPWGEGDECCGGAGMPCPVCNETPLGVEPKALAGSKVLCSLKVLLH